VRHWRVFWGRITSASDAWSFSLVFLSAGFGALFSGVSLRSLPLCSMYYRYISGSALWESPRERKVRARRSTPLNVTQVLPYGQSRIPRNLRQDASWQHLPLPLLLCPPSPVASKVIRPVGRCTLSNFERPPLRRIEGADAESLRNPRRWGALRKRVSRCPRSPQTCNGKRPSSPARAPAGRGSQSPVPLAYLDGQTRIAAQLDRQAVH
jgi:hypothetical protein